MSDKLKLMFLKHNLKVFSNLQARIIEMQLKIDRDS